MCMCKNCMNGKLSSMNTEIKALHMQIKPKYHDSQTAVSTAFPRNQQNYSCTHTDVYMTDQKTPPVEEGSEEMSTGDVLMKLRAEYGE